MGAPAESKPASGQNPAPLTDAAKDSLFRPVPAPASSTAVALRKTPELAGRQPNVQFVFEPSFESARDMRALAEICESRMRALFESTSAGAGWDEKKCATLLSEMGYEDPQAALRSFQLSTFEERHAHALKLEKGLEKMASGSDGEFRAKCICEANMAASMLLSQFTPYILHESERMEFIPHGLENPVATVFDYLRNAHCWLAGGNMASLMSAVAQDGQYAYKPTKILDEAYEKLLPSAVSFAHGANMSKVYRERIRDFYTTYNAVAMRQEVRLEREKGKVGLAGADRLHYLLEPYVQAATPIVAAAAMMTPGGVALGTFYFGLQAKAEFGEGHYFTGALISATLLAPLAGAMAASGGIAGQAGRAGLVASHGAGKIFQLQIAGTSVSVLADASKCGMSEQDLVQLGQAAGFMVMPVAAKKAGEMARANAGTDNFGALVPLPVQNETPEIPRISRPITSVNRKIGMLDQKGFAAFPGKRRKAEGGGEGRGKQRGLEEEANEAMVREGAKPAANGKSLTSEELSESKRASEFAKYLMAAYDRNAGSRENSLRKVNKMLAEQEAGGDFGKQVAANLHIMGTGLLGKCCYELSLETRELVFETRDASQVGARLKLAGDEAGRLSNWNGKGEYYIQGAGGIPYLAEGAGNGQIRVYRLNVAMVPGTGEEKRASIVMVGIPEDSIPAARRICEKYTAEARAIERVIMAVGERAGLDLRATALDVISPYEGIMGNIELSASYAQNRREKDVSGRVPQFVKENPHFNFADAASAASAILAIPEKSLQDAGWAALDALISKPQCRPEHIEIFGAAVERLGSVLATASRYELSHYSGNDRTFGTLRTLVERPEFDPASMMGLVGLCSMHGSISSQGNAMARLSKLISRGVDFYEIDRFERQLGAELANRRDAPKPAENAAPAQRARQAAETAPAAQPSETSRSIAKAQETLASLCGEDSELLSGSTLALQAIAGNPSFIRTWLSGGSMAGIVRSVGHIRSSTNPEARDAALSIFLASLSNPSFIPEYLGQAHAAVISKIAESISARMRGRELDFAIQTMRGIAQNPAFCTSTMPKLVEQVAGQAGALPAAKLLASIETMVYSEGYEPWHASSMRKAVEAVFSQPAGRAREEAVAALSEICIHEKFDPGSILPSLGVLVSSSEGQARADALWEVLGLLGEKKFVPREMSDTLALICAQARGPNIAPALSSFRSFVARDHFAPEMAGMLERVVAGRKGRQVAPAIENHARIRGEIEAEHHIEEYWEGGAQNAENAQQAARKAVEETRKEPQEKAPEPVAVAEKPPGPQAVPMQFLKSEIYSNYHDAVAIVEQNPNFFGAPEAARFAAIAQKLWEAPHYRQVHQNLQALSSLAKNPAFRPEMAGTLERLMKETEPRVQNGFLKAVGAYAASEGSELGPSFGALGRILSEQPYSSNPEMRRAAAGALSSLLETKDCSAALVGQFGKLLDAAPADSPSQMAQYFFALSVVFRNPRFSGAKMMGPLVELCSGRLFARNTVESIRAFNVKISSERRPDLDAFAKSAKEAEKAKMNPTKTKESFAKRRETKAAESMLKMHVEGEGVENEKREFAKRALELETKYSGRRIASGVDSFLKRNDITEADVQSLGRSLAIIAQEVNPRSRSEAVASLCGLLSSPNAPLTIPCAEIVAASTKGYAVADALLALDEIGKKPGVDSGHIGIFESIVRNGSASVDRRNVSGVPAGLYHLLKNPKLELGMLPMIEATSRLETVLRNSDFYRSLTALLSSPQYSPKAGEAAGLAFSAERTSTGRAHAVNALRAVLEHPDFQERHLELFGDALGALMKSAAGREVPVAPHALYELVLSKNFHPSMLEAAAVAAEGIEASCRGYAIGNPGNEAKLTGLQKRALHSLQALCTRPEFELGHVKSFLNAVEEISHADGSTHLHSFRAYLDVVENPRCNEPVLDAAVGVVARNPNTRNQTLGLRAIQNIISAKGYDERYIRAFNRSCGIIDGMAGKYAPPAYGALYDYLSSSHYKPEIFGPLEEMLRQHKSPSRLDRAIKNLTADFYEGELKPGRRGK